MTPEQFISRWKTSGASERANYQLFLLELCELLSVEKPRPASDKVHEASYSFERPVDFDDGEGKKVTNFIDLYKQHCFVLEAKQGSDKAEITEAEILGAGRVKTKTGTAKRDTRNWDREMKKAKEQALRYARSLPATDGWPPFLVVVDVGFCLDLYSDFARQGKTYVAYPDPLNYRIGLEDLAKDEIRERLRLLFTDPLQLDPSKRAAKVTRELAERLAKLASLLEQAGHPPEKVAGFLMRCLFTMFAEDVQLLPEKSFTQLLQDYREQLDLLPQALQSLWVSMDKGGFDPALRSLIPQFNGFLFKEQEALPITTAQADLLILASQADWGEVEPAIFGTLLERALQPRERHKLGAHYTPRAYVERLVMPTVIEPLREEWEAARAASAILETKGDDAGALKEINKFHRRLCSVRILDPACGSGNFLYVTLEHLKRLEGEVAEYIAHFPRQLGLDMTGGYTVTPAQFLGLEVNPRAAAIADVVLWIGYLQWHFRTHGHAKRLEDPILRQYGNIQLQDAVLSYTSTLPRVNENGEAMTRWDGHTTKPHPVTGLEVPDEMARTPIVDYIDPKPAIWPEADFIVGNPPFIGNKRMREVLGDGYVEALRKAHKGSVPESVDFVMYWWNKAAMLLVDNKAERFGFITTNSIIQSFNRKVLQDFLDLPKPISVVYAIPDHPWVDSMDGAAVRIAMTVVSKNRNQIGTLDLVISEVEVNDSIVDVTLTERNGLIHSNLKIGVNLAEVVPLNSNQEVSARGIIPHGEGFIVDEDTKSKLEAKSGNQSIIKPYRNGRDINQISRGIYVIDTFGLDESQLRNDHPKIYQWLFERVKPERDENKDKGRRENWWLHARSNEKLRGAINNLTRYIVTVQTSKFRNFTFLNAEIMPDDKLIAIGFEDAYFLGVLSSNFHIVWSSALGGRMGVGNDLVYDKNRCFEPYPFPITTDEKKQSIRIIAEQLDAHRKKRQAEYPMLTLTEMYNVLEKLRSGVSLNDKEQEINEQGLIGILLKLHSELDAAVADAYGWPTNLTDEEILEKLVALNKERAAEESRGLIRWLRPEYQNPKGQVQQVGLDISASASTIPKLVDQSSEWPKNLAEQAQIIQQIVLQSQHPVSATAINKQFKKAPKTAAIAREQQIGQLLETLNGLGLLRKTGEGLFVR
jgi:hypothetical protein